MSDALQDSGINHTMLVVAGAIAIIAPLVSIGYVLLGNADRRFASTPPGVIAPPDTPTRRDTTPAERIPVRFTPPDIPVAAAGLLIHDRITARETTATLVSLAFRGAIELSREGENPVAVLRDRALATQAHEIALLDGLYPEREPGSVVPLGHRAVGDGRMAMAHTLHASFVRDLAEQSGWYKRMPNAGPWTEVARKFHLSMSGVMALCAIGFFGFLGITDSNANGAKAVVVLIPLVSVILAGLALHHHYSLGKRAALGRALTDQAIGFCKYLQTAEANQLRFEDGEDIFGRYLPWAIVFDLTDHWRTICSKLVAESQFAANASAYIAPSVVFGDPETTHEISRSFAVNKGAHAKGPKHRAT